MPFVSVESLNLRDEAMLSIQWKVFGYKGDLHMGVVNKTMPRLYRHQALYVSIVAATPNEIARLDPIPGRDVAPTIISQAMENLDPKLLTKDQHHHTLTQTNAFCRCFFFLLSLPSEGVVPEWFLGISICLSDLAGLLLTNTIKDCYRLFALLVTGYLSFQIDLC